MRRREEKYTTLKILHEGSEIKVKEHALLCSLIAPAKIASAERGISYMIIQTLKFISFFQGVLVSKYG